MDGPPRYFDDIKDTGIPELQRLCPWLAERNESREAISSLKRMLELVVLVEAQLRAYIQEHAALIEFRLRWKDEPDR